MSDKTDTLLQEISEKMDKMMKLMVIDILRNSQNIREKIDLLDTVGFKPVEIANLLGKTSTNVRVQLVSIRKKRGVDEKQSGSPNQNENVENEGNMDESTK